MDRISYMKQANVERFLCKRYCQNIEDRMGLNRIFENFTIVLKKSLRYLFRKHSFFVGNALFTDIGINSWWNRIFISFEIISFDLPRKKIYHCKWSSVQCFKYVRKQFALNIPNNCSWFTWPMLNNHLLAILSNDWLKLQNLSIRKFQQSKIPRFHAAKRRQTQIRDLKSKMCVNINPIVVVNAVAFLAIRPISKPQHAPIRGTLCIVRHTKQVAKSSFCDCCFFPVCFCWIHWNF